MNPRSPSTTTRRACSRTSSTARSTCTGSTAGWCPSWPRAITCGGCCRWCAPRSSRRKPRPQQLDGVAYTAGPGLIGALLTGAALGRSLAYAWDIPAVAVHHLEGHLLAPLLEPVPPPFPHLALLVSGGHTMLIDVSARRRLRRARRDARRCGRRGLRQVGQVVRAAVSRRAGARAAGGAGASRDASNSRARCWIAPGSNSASPASRPRCRWRCKESARSTSRRAPTSPPACRTPSSTR